MKTKPSVIAPTSKQLFTSFVHPTGILVSDKYATIGTTSNLVYESLLTNSYTIDVSRIMSVVEISVYIETGNDANGECKLQISGDGGSTWVDMTTDIGTGALITGGPGRWISSIDLGQNKLQERILGRSTDGNPANIKIGYDSGNVYILNK